MNYDKPNRQIDRVFIHCSASDDESLDGRALFNWVRKIHVGQNSWNHIGYHYLIDKTGEVMDTDRPTDLIPAAQRGHNAGTIAIMVHGLEDFSQASLDSLWSLCEQINRAHEGRITFHGHREVDPNKTCPVFDYSKLLDLDEFGRMPA